MKSNCYVWCFKQRILHGGKINIRRTITWRGPHTTWTDKQGQEWEFTFRFPRRHPWWYIPLWYEGVIKRVGEN